MAGHSSPIPPADRHVNDTPHRSRRVIPTFPPPHTHGSIREIMGTPTSHESAACPPPVWGALTLNRELRASTRQGWPGGNNCYSADPRVGKGVNTGAAVELKSIYARGEGELLIVGGKLLFIGRREGKVPAGMRGGEGSKLLIKLCLHDSRELGGNDPTACPHGARPRDIWQALNFSPPFFLCSCSIFS